MNRRSVIIGIGLMLLSVYGVFQIKFRVQELRQELSEMNYELTQEKEALHVLEAEWAYLNEPSRLQKLSAEYLHTDYVSVAQIRDVNDVPEKNNHLVMVSTENNTANLQ